MNKDIKCPECNTTLDLNSLLSEQNKNELFNEIEKNNSDKLIAIENNHKKELLAMEKSKKEAIEKSKKDSEKWRSKDIDEAVNAKINTLRQAIFT